MLLKHEASVDFSTNVNDLYFFVMDFRSGGGGVADKKK
jgi:hypothetical protein